MNTLLLDRTLWDLCLDTSGNIALAAAPYALAQDVASSARTNLGEVWYDGTIGVPYTSQILGHAPPLQWLKAQFVKAALRVPGVVRARCFLVAVARRGVTGQIQTTDHAGVTQYVGF